MAEVIGTIASVLQLIGSISTGLKTLRNAIARIRGASDIVAQLEQRVHHLRTCFTLVEDTIKQGTHMLPHELEFRRVIRDLTTNSYSSLKLLQETIPSGKNKAIVKAYQIWAKDHTLTQSMSHVDEYAQHLTLLLQALNLFKSDRVDEKLREIASHLRKTAQPRPLIQGPQDAAILEDDRKAFETGRKVRDLANNTAALVSLRTAGVLTPSDSSTIAPSSFNSAHPPMVEGKNRTRVRREIDFELAGQQKALAVYKARGLFESAVMVQRRILVIQEELAVQHSVLCQHEEIWKSQEVLAELLIECQLESGTEEALSVLEEVLDTESAAHAGAADEKPSPVSPPSGPTEQDKLRIHLKLGKLYKETLHLNRAEYHLREAFNAYAIETHKDNQKIGDVGEQLLDLYRYRAEHAGMDQHAVLIGQLNGFRDELESVTGHSLGPPPQCEDALAWCRIEKIPVEQVGRDYRFDMLDVDGSSPLHNAAERCQTEVVIRQMLNNSDTLENKDAQGDTPLLVAVRSANLTALSLLMQKGCDINARDSQYQTPLHRSQKPTVTELLLRGRLRRASTMSSVLFEQERRDSSSSTTTFLSPTTSSSASTLPDQDLDIDAQDAHKKTALYMACTQGREKIVQLLLLAGANPNITRHNHSPLAAAIQSQSLSYLNHPRRRVNIVAELMRRNANPEEVRNLAELRKPGIMREIKKVLEGQYAATLPLTPSSSVREAGNASIDDADGKWSLSSSSSGKAVHLELPDLGPTSFNGFIDSEK